MKRILYTIVLSFFAFSTLPAQNGLEVECGAPGTSVTINKWELNKFGRSQCAIDYNITLVATEVGEYRIEAVGQSLVTMNALNKGTITFPGQSVSIFPCIFLGRNIRELYLFTPSERCKISTNELAKLPVKLTYFTAMVEEDGVNLQWATEIEQNNEGFLIEHSRDADDWSPIDFVEGAGSTTEPQTYGYLVEDLPAGEHYFRLKQMDFDGRFEYSPIANVLLEDESNTLKIFPNPVLQGQTLTIQGRYDQAILYNATGQRISDFLNTSEGTLPQFIDVPAGFYQVVIYQDGKIVQKKLIVQ